MNQPQMGEMPVREGTDSREKPRAGGDAIGIMAVIVLYKMQPSDSVSLQTLTAAAEHLRSVPGGERVRLRILVADNTPGGQRIETMPGNVDYRLFPDNPGLSPVYNMVIGEMEDESDWLLTLDQDTHLPLAFLISMAEHASKYQNDKQIAAIVPRVFDGARPVSPLRFVHGFPRIVDSAADMAADSGMLGTQASAVNSAALLRLSALKSVGGYDNRFPLNNSDTALFERLDRAGYRIALAGDVAVQHEFSMLQREDRMTLERYRQLLKDERDFWDLHMSAMARTERVLRLMGRLANSYLKREDRGFQRVTSEELKYRLFTSRTRRMRGAGSQAVTR